MTQLEFMVKQYIQDHPRCTQAEIMSGFARPLEKPVLDNVLKALSLQHQIKVLPIQSKNASKPQVTYYFPAEVKPNMRVWPQA